MMFWAKVSKRIEMKKNTNIYGFLFFQIGIHNFFVVVLNFEAFHIG
jgi:hypothetical protein